MAGVDLAIQPVVAWLNSFAAARVLQAAEHGDQLERVVAVEGHVGAICIAAARVTVLNAVALATVLGQDGPGGYRVRVEWWDGSLRYVLQLNDKDALRALSALIRAERLGDGR